jgi:hypothetical protein
MAIGGATGVRQGAKAIAPHRVRRRTRRTFSTFNMGGSVTTSVVMIWDVMRRA